MFLVKKNRLPVDFFFGCCRYYGVQLHSLMVVSIDLVEIDLYEVHAVNLVTSEQLT